MDLGTLERQHNEIEEVVENIKRIIDNNNINKDAVEIAKQISILTGKLRVHLRTEDTSMYPYLLETGNDHVKALAKEYADEMGHISNEFMAYKDKFNTRTKILNDPQEFLDETKQTFKILGERMEKEDRHLYKYIYKWRYNMSLFLGKIHYWLYNKIKWAEKMEEDIVEWAKAQDLPAEQWKKEAIDKYGEPVGNKILEDEIDTTNIHGWLQARIQSAELRQAYLVTTVLEAKPELKDSLIKPFEDQGKKAAKEYTADITTPEGAFNALNDFILEGMPCDRVNQVISSDDEKYSWRTTACLHKDYWDQVEGDVSIFYTLRDAWVKAFIETLTPKFKYTKTEDAVHEITR